MDPDKIDGKILCKYGIKCYQKNEKHKRLYHHIQDSSNHIDEMEPVIKKRKIVVDSFEKKDTNDNTECDTPPCKDILLPVSPQKIIKEKFLVEMPNDFFDIWKYCKSLCPEQPEDALKCAGLVLCGPFDVISGKINELSDMNATLCHYRYYYDPPEFQTVIAGDQDEYHIGYYRDIPSDLPVFVASMSDKKPGLISAMGENLFSAIIFFLNSSLKERSIFERNKIQQLIKSTEKFAEDNNYDIGLKTAGIESRKKKVVAKTFHGAGIVVPVNKETDVGYREIPETTATLKKIFKRIKDATDDSIRETHNEVLHELVTQVQFANDEGDYGMGLELAIDLFTYGGEEFHSTILHLLSVAYDLLNRNDFFKILEAHFTDRRKGSQMSRF